jgi:hypothetical protein
VISAIVTMLALGATDPCAPVSPAPSPDPAAAAEYRAVAQSEQAAGAWDTAAAAWQKAAALDPRDGAAPDALAALCREGKATRPGGDPLHDAIRLLDAGQYREAAELLRQLRRTRPGADAALLEGICRYELGEDGEASRLLREAETDPEHRDTARLYLGLLALRGGSALEAATLFDEAANNPSLAALATDLSRSSRWEGPLVLSLKLEGGWDSNVSLAGTQGGQSAMSGGDAVAGLSAIAVGRPFGANGPYLRGAGALQQYARLDRYDLTSWEAAAGWRQWRGGTGFNAEYSFADRTLGGDAFLRTHRLLAAGSVALGTVALTGSWWGRKEDYGPLWAPFSGWAQRADGRVTFAIGARARIGAGWAWGRDDAGTSYLGWKEHGPRADLRVVLGPRTRVAVEAGYTSRAYTGHDPVVGVRLRESALDGAAALEWDLARRTTLRFSLLGRWSDSNYDPFDYKKVVPSAAIGLMMTP